MDETQNPLPVQNWMALSAADFLYVCSQCLYILKDTTVHVTIKLRPAKSAVQNICCVVFEALQDCIAVLKELEKVKADKKTFASNRG